MTAETHCTACGRPILNPDKAHRFRFPNGRHAGIYCSVLCCGRCGEDDE